MGTPLTFTASGSATVTMRNYGSAMKYRFGTSGDFINYSGQTIELESGGVVQFENDANTSGMRFTISGSVAASGNLSALTGYSTAAAEYGFQSIFEGCGGLTALPDMSDIILSRYCFYRAFYGCTGLSFANYPSASIIPEGAFSNMYAYSGINSAAALTATSVSASGYKEMFAGTRLSSAPVISAKNLGDNAMEGMFHGTGISYVDLGSVTALGKGSLKNAFSGCAGLSRLTVGFSDWAVDSDGKPATENWLQGVAPMGNIDAPVGLAQNIGASYIPAGWTFNGNAVVDPNIVTITVSSPVSVTGSVDAAITAVQLSATVSNGATPTFTANNFPEGLTCSETGEISGTPTADGTFSGYVVVSAEGADSKNIIVNFTIAKAGEEPSPSPDVPVIDYGKTIAEKLALTSELIAKLKEGGSTPVVATSEFYKAANLNHATWHDGVIHDTWMALWIFNADEKYNGLW
ncbi:MAG: hypothetical protein IKB77_04605, partial [Lentisphaeria bacterium]|nr:hypothetical protein [Lentisphaeria bacterium]